MRSETISIEGISYNLNIHYEKRKDTRASISKNNIHIRIPVSLSREEQFKNLVKMRLWAINKVKKNPKKFKPKPQRIYQDEDTFQVDNEKYILKINFKDNKISSARIINNIIYIVISSNIPKDIQNKHISQLLGRCIASKRLLNLKKKINELNNKHFKQKINNISFKNKISNWGSCSENRNINISTRLLFAPDDILEYVCIHELAHLIEMNHSEKFWDLIEKAMPNYKEKEKWLKDEGNNCGF